MMVFLEHLRRVLSLFGIVIMVATTLGWCFILLIEFSEFSKTNKRIAIGVATFVIVSIFCSLSYFI